MVCIKCREGNHEECPGYRDKTWCDCHHIDLTVKESDPAIDRVDCLWMKKKTESETCISGT